MKKYQPVEPREIARILNLPIGDRCQALAEGLELLVDHVQALKLSVEALKRADDTRGKPILEAVMGEEAAKVLIVLDVVRGGWNDQVAAGKRLNYFSSHFVRGIYQRVTSINPGTFGEVHRYVDSLRPDFYLDGPTGGDWIFRNDIESARELSFYVDYVREEDGLRWVSPGDGFQPPHNYPAQITADLVLAMGRTGLLTTGGLEIVADHWAGVVVTETTNNLDNSGIVASDMNALIAKELFGPSATDADFRKVSNGWPFSLNSLDLSKILVTKDELSRERDRAEHAFRTGEM